MSMNDVENFIGIYDDVFSAEECNEIIEYFNTLESRNLVLSSSFETPNDLPKLPVFATFSTSQPSFTYFCSYSSSIFLASFQSIYPSVIFNLVKCKFGFSLMNFVLNNYPHFNNSLLTQICTEKSIKIGVFTQFLNLSLRFIYYTIVIQNKKTISSFSKLT